MSLCCGGGMPKDTVRTLILSTLNLIIEQSTINLGSLYNTMWSQSKAGTKTDWNQLYWKTTFSETQKT